MYRKPTYMDRYLHAESHSAQKQSAINSLYKAFIVSDKNIRQNLII